MGCGASKNKQRVDPVLQVCVRSNSAEAVTVALERVGVDINGADERGMTALMYAAVLGKDEAISVLVAKGANTEMVDRNGMTAAMHAAYAGKHSALKKLEGAGARLSPGCAHRTHARQ
jgi:ankyrin repeat protein